MADKSESDIKRKKHKKKNKKTEKSSAEEPESAAVESADANASPNEKPASPEQSPVALKETKSSPEKMAPKAQSSNRQWSHDQEDMLLKNLKRYASKLSGKQQHSQRVDWARVEQVDDFTQFEMQEQYKTLAKKVRKTRSALEIVEDALILHKEKKTAALAALKNIKRPSKQAPTAFLIYCKTKRASLVEKHPDLRFHEIHKKLCERWKELPEDKREKYVAKAEEARLEYYQELRKFQEELVSTIKKPLTAFDLWKTERLEDDDLDGDETDNDFLVEWENLPKSTKKGWLQAAAGEKERFDIEKKSMLKDSKVKPEKKPKNEKSSTETKTKEEPMSDERQQSSSLLENSGLKRKINNSSQADKSPTKKVKKESSSSESSESSSSSDED